MNKVLLLIVMFTMFFSCKNSTKKTSEEIAPIVKKDNIENEIQTTKSNIKEQPIDTKRNIINDRNKAKKEINEFLSNSPQYWAPLVLNYYIVDFVSEGQTAPKDIIDLGEWYKFDKTFKYEHGFFDKIADKGRYSFELEKKTLLMLPYQENKFPSEWKLLNSADVIVMVGTPKFGNNPVQKHMQNVSKKPEIIE